MPRRHFTLAISSAVGHDTRIRSKTQYLRRHPSPSRLFFAHWRATSRVDDHIPAGYPTSFRTLDEIPAVRQSADGISLAGSDRRNDWTATIRLLPDVYIAETRGSDPYCDCGRLSRTPGRTAFGEQNRLPLRSGRAGGARRRARRQPVLAHASGNDNWRPNRGRHDRPRNVYRGRLRAECGGGLVCIVGTRHLNGLPISMVDFARGARRIGADGQKCRSRLLFDFRTPRCARRMLRAEFCHRRLRRSTRVRRCNAILSSKKQRSDEGNDNQRNGRTADGAGR